MNKQINKWRKYSNHKSHFDYGWTNKLINEENIQQMFNVIKNVEPILILNEQINERKNSLQF